MMNMAMSPNSSPSSFSVGFKRNSDGAIVNSTSNSNSELASALAAASTRGLVFEGQTSMMPSYNPPIGASLQMVPNTLPDMSNAFFIDPNNIMCMEMLPSASMMPPSMASSYLSSWHSASTDNDMPAATSLPFPEDPMVYLPQTNSMTSSHNTMPFFMPGSTISPQDKLTMGAFGDQLGNVGFDAELMEQPMKRRAIEMSFPAEANREFHPEHMQRSESIESRFSAASDFSMSPFSSLPQQTYQQELRGNRRHIQNGLRNSNIWPKPEDGKANWPAAYGMANRQPGNTGRASSLEQSEDSISTPVSSTATAIPVPVPARTTTAVSVSASYARPARQRVYCRHCTEQPAGFRGDHELRRHCAARHEARVKKWRCVEPEGDAIQPINPISECKACRAGKLYGADYNALAHLRRAHFQVKKPRGRANTGESQRDAAAKTPSNKPSSVDLRPYLQVLSVPSSSNDAEDSLEIESEAQAEMLTGSHWDSPEDEPDQSLFLFEA
ncbi:putative key lime pathogenicity protein [Ceratocystis lukuohia]